MIINQTGGGQTPTGTTQITSNGTHNVAGYEFADVNVPTSAPAHYVEKVNDGNGVLVNGATSVIDLTGITDVGNYVLTYAYYNDANLTTLPDFSGIQTLSGLYACQYMLFACANLTGNVDLSSLTTVSGNNACQYMFSQSNITSADLSSLTTVSGNNGCNGMFEQCQNLISANLSSLTTVSGSNGCKYMLTKTGITSIDLSSLTTISGGSGCQYMLYNCQNLISANLSSLTTVSGSNGCQYMFSGCKNLPRLDFCSLSIISASGALQYLCQNCTSLQTLSFYALDTTSFGTSTNQFAYMLQNCSNVTVHFPMRIQSTIGSWTTVTGGFGGTNTTVLFDIVCTLTGADSNSYVRQQKDSTSTATAWDLGGVLYYTSGTAEPVVNDTIYSDAGCTQVVTTVAAIA